MKQYLDGLRTILNEGFDSKPARANMPPTKVYNDLQMRFDLRNGKLPIITTKKMTIRSITAELLCFMAGKTDVRDYAAMGCNVWWDNAYNWNVLEVDRPSRSKEAYMKENLPDAKYDLGRIYAAQWRNYKGRCNSERVVSINLEEDQLSNMIESITKTPESRYHVMNAWNPAEMNWTLVSQPNCHVYFQATCRELSFEERETILFKKRGLITPYANGGLDGEKDRELLEIHNIPKYALRTHLTQRSCDMFLGVPFNITSYAMFTHILARITNTVAEEFVWNGVNCHIYGNHIEQVNEQLSRKPEEVPTITLDDSLTTLRDFEYLVENPDWFKNEFKHLFRLSAYTFHAPIKGDLSVGL